MDRFHCVVLTPSTGFTRMGYTMSLFNMMTYFTSVRVSKDLETQMLEFDAIEGSGISSNREMLVRHHVKRSDVTHLLFIDEDMCFDPRSLHVMASKELDIVGANYPHRIPNKGFTALAKDMRSRVEVTEDKTGAEECTYTGFGFCLIRREVFVELPQPWFLIGYNTERKEYTTEDMGFSRVLKEHGKYKWYVDHDVSKMVGHFGSFRYTWKGAHDVSLGLKKVEGD